MEPNGLGQIGNCSVVVAVTQISGTSGGKSESVVGIESNGLGQIDNCSVVVVTVKITDTTGDKAVSALGSESNGLCAILNGLGVVAFSRINASPDGKGLSAFGIELNGLIGGRDHLLIVTLVEFCACLVHQGRVARSHLSRFFRLALLLRLSCCELLLLGFGGLAFCFCVGGF